MSTPETPQDPTLLDSPVRPIVPVRGTRRMAGWLGKTIFLVVLAGLFALWWTWHRPIMAMLAYSLSGATVEWSLGGSRWKHGGDTTVRFMGSAFMTKGPGLERLVELHRLTELDLSQYDRPTPEGYRTLARLADLEKLDLSRTVARALGDPEAVRIPPGALEGLRGLKRLRELDLSHSSVDDDAVAILARFPRLESLSLRGTAVTDAGMRRLKALKSLKHLDVEETTVTDKGLAELTDALPELEVFRPQPVPGMPRGTP